MRRRGGKKKKKENSMLSARAFRQGKRKTTPYSEKEGVNLDAT